MYLVLIIPVFLSFLCSCSHVDDEITGHFFRIFEENGVTIAETTGGPKFSGELFSYERGLSLQEDPTNPESLLYNTGQFWMDERGQFFIQDYGDNRIAVYNKYGEFVQSIGRDGDGPGEFRNFKFQYLREGVLSLWDNRHQRTTNYRTDGTLIDILTPSKAIILSGFMRDSENRYYSYMNPDSTYEGIIYRMVQLTITDDIGDTLSVIKTPYVKTWSRFRSSGRGVVFKQSFSGTPNLLLLNDGTILWSIGEIPILSFFNVEGLIQRQIRLDIPRPVVGDELRRRLQKEVSDKVREAVRQGDQFNEDFFSAYKIPKSMAFWDVVFQDSYGYIWLRYTRSYFVGTDNYLNRYRVLTPEGEYLGDTTWPVSSGSLCFGKILTFHSDSETGRKTPITYSIHSAIPGLEYPN